MPSRATIAILVVTVAAEATVAAAQSGAGRDDPNRLICRRMPESGSLAATRRQCFTKSEWDRIAELARRGAERTAQGLSSTSQSN